VELEHFLCLVPAFFYFCLCVLTRLLYLLTSMQELLDEWSPSTLASFVKVMPTDYKRVLEAKKQKELDASTFVA